MQHSPPDFFQKLFWCFFFASQWLEPANQPTSKQTNQPTNKQTNPTKQPTNQPTQSPHQPPLFGFFVASRNQQHRDSSRPSVIDGELVQGFRSSNFARAPDLWNSEPCSLEENCFFGKSRGLDGGASFVLSPGKNFSYSKSWRFFLCETEEWWINIQQKWDVRCFFAFFSTTCSVTFKNFIWNRGVFYGSFSTVSRNCTLAFTWRNDIESKDV